MKRVLAILTGGVCLSLLVSAARAAEGELSALERQFRQLPIEARRLTGPLFWLHGDETRQRLEEELDKVAEGGNGCFTTESRGHTDWLGPTWYRDLAVCLEAARKHDLKMWIFDEKWWPSQGVDGKVPPRYAAKRLEAASTEVEGPRAWEADGYAGDRYLGAVAGKVEPASSRFILGDSLVDLASFIRDGKLSWQVPAGKWKIMKFSHIQAPGLEEEKCPTVDGASPDCVDWFLKTVYQPHYERFGADFGKHIAGYFYDEPVTYGDWGTELPRVLAEWNVDWKKPYVAYKFQLAGEDQAAARFQYLDAFAEAWGRTMYGGMSRWCHAHGVASHGHFIEHYGAYLFSSCCAGDMMRVQKYSDMGAIDAVGAQFLVGNRSALDDPTFQTPKLASSISHVFGKPDDLAMVEIFGARGQDLTYPAMKWWTDHMQVSGVNFLIPHSFNPRAPYDTDAPPYFYNGGFEPRWPMYRVWADYSSRLSLMLSGGRHVCPVALLFCGNLYHVGKGVTPEDMTTALQNAQFDCDWLPMEVFERDTVIKPRPAVAGAASGAEIQLHGERYRVLIVPPVELIPYGTLAKAKEFFDQGGVVLGYGFLPSKSATIGKTSAEIVALCREIWGPQAKPGPAACNTSPAGGRSYFLPATAPTEAQLAACLADAGIHPDLEVLAGQTDGWLHVLHRQKAGRDVFLVCNQVPQGEARQFTFRLTAEGEPECWDAVRDEITAPRFRRIDEGTIEMSLTLEPLESVLLVFQPEKIARPPRIEPDATPLREPIRLTRIPNPPVEPPRAYRRGKPLTLGPVGAADPFRAKVTLPADVDLAHSRVYLEMDDLPDHSAAVTINGVKAGGVIGRPTRLEITRQLKPGENTVLVEPLAPKAARLLFYE